MLSPPRLARRVRELAAAIERDYAGRETVIVALLNGTVMFLADLIRHLSIPLRLDFMGVSSYGLGTESGGLILTKDLRLDLEGRDVLLVDDILDTGRTLRCVRDHVDALRPRRVRTCVLLDKAARRIEPGGRLRGLCDSRSVRRRLRIGFAGDRYRICPSWGCPSQHVYSKACQAASNTARRRRRSPPDAVNKSRAPRGFRRDRGHEILHRT